MASNLKISPILRVEAGVKRHLKWIAFEHILFGHTVRTLIKHIMNCRNIQKIASILALFLLFMANQVLNAFEFKKGDRVCIVGNSLADRMQHNGWLEALLQSGGHDLELSFRNLGVSGDQVNFRPRSAGWSSPEAHLSHCEADVVFALFGYNESFKGKEGLKDFVRDLENMIKSYRKMKFNGRTQTRIVLFSPIAHENLNSELLPDGKANNIRLSMYAEAMKNVADKMDVGFIDLYQHSLKWYMETKQPLTINGIHLSDHGYKKLAQEIAPLLLNKSVKASESKIETIRKAVLEKNFYWHNRYRATDGNDVWGGRSKLKFLGQTNRTVLQKELEILDVMVNNRDKVIWATAGGKTLTVDDSNVPEKIKVSSNIGKDRHGKSSKVGSVRYLSAEESLKKIKVPKDLEASVFASEASIPGLINPVQMAVDPGGRLWVSAWKSYPKLEPHQELEDQLMILNDKDGDGKADSATTFAKVHNPTGFAFWNGGVLVASAPDILFLKDTDGDDKADQKIIVLQGLDSADTHHAANNLTIGPDGALYFQRGVFHVSHVETPWGPAKLNKSNHDGLYRFDPRTYRFSFVVKNGPNAHGISFDHWGYHMITDGTSGKAFQVHLTNKGFVRRTLLKKKVRPVAGSGVLYSSHLPKQYQGRFLICNTIGFLGLKQYNLNYDPIKGLVNGSEVENFLVSTDRNFRPTGFVTGPDGSVFVSDWCNVIIGHMQHNIRDPNRDHSHGRIFRVTAKNRPLQKQVKVQGQSIENLLQNLVLPDPNIRARTRSELSGRNSQQVIAACKKWMKQFDTKKQDDAHHLLEALWLHQQHHIKDMKLLNVVLNSPEAHARVAARTVQFYWSKNIENMVVQNDEPDHLSIKNNQKMMAEDKETAVVTIKTVAEKMIYDKKSFSVKAGQKVKLIFENVDFMPHNLLIVNPATVEEVANAAAALGNQGFEKEWIPENKNVLWASRLIDHGEKSILRFKAPEKPGNYEFVCTMPGHWMRMRGVMIVTDKVMTSSK